MGYLVRHRTLARFAYNFEGVFWLVEEMLTADSAHTKFLCNLAGGHSQTIEVEKEKYNTMEDDRVELTKRPAFLSL